MPRQPPAARTKLNDQSVRRQKAQIVMLEPVPEQVSSPVCVADVVGIRKLASVTGPSVKNDDPTEAVSAVVG